MRLAIWILFILIGTYTYSQSITVTKRQLFKTLQASINQPVKNKVLINSKSWIICNNDSSFYLKDTITLFSRFDYNLIHVCCKFINWTFYKKDRFVLNEEQLCKEPSSGTVPKTTDWYKIKVFKIDPDIIIEARNKANYLMKFKVLLIGKVSDSDINKDRIVLKRIY